MNTHHKKTSSGGFTLIELLIVITIIAILASLVLAVAGSVQNKGARSRTEAEIAAMGAALESYKADNGDYPEGSASSILITTLMPSSGKVYFEFGRKSLATNITPIITTNNEVISTNFSTNISYNDPFGAAYEYRYPGLPNQSGTNNYDLWSTAGGSTVTNTWIKNW
jgi:prepilin-type N-terminal cleavage/methylation domain-containing protein